MNSTTESLPVPQQMPPTSNTTNSTMYAISYRNYVEHPDYSSIRFQNDDGSRNTVRETLVEKAIARGVMQFALQMDYALSTDDYMNKGDKSNIVFSPVSIALAMALVMIGAAGRTYTEIANLLGLAAGVDLVSHGDEIHYHFGKFIKKIEEYADTPMVTMAGGIFVQDGFPLKERFTNLSKGTYESEVLNLDFTGHSSEARDIINNWVQNRTYGHIPNILDYTPPPSTRVIIASALYFSGAWKYPFLPTTKWRPFYVTGSADHNSSEVLNVPMMENGADFPYFSDPVLGCQVVGLPYKDNTATMYLVLPNVPGYQALKHLLYRLTVNKLQGLADSTKETTVLIRLPRMKLESTIYLKEALEVLGVHTLFDPIQADLSQISEHKNADYFISTDCLGNKNVTQEHKSSDNITLTTYPCTEYRTLHMNTSTGKMLKQSINQTDSVKKRETKDTELSASEIDSNVSNNGGLYADDVIHKVTIDVTEVGTEAAATSVVTLTRDGSYKLVKFDRPFLFFIRHEATGCILFWGTVVKPTPNYEVPSVK